MYETIFGDCVVAVDTSNGCGEGSEAKALLDSCAGGYRGILGELAHRIEVLTLERDGSREALASVSDALIADRERLSARVATLEEQLEAARDDNEHAWDRAGGLALEVEALTADNSRLCDIVKAYVAQARADGRPSRAPWRPLGDGSVLTDEQKKLLNSLCA